MTLTAPWPDTDTEKLKKLYADGLSFGLIAQQMPEYSRNAVIGKAGRLGLEKRGRKKNSSYPAKRKPYRNGYTGPVPGAPRTTAPKLSAEPLPTTPLDDLLIPQEQRITSVLDLTAGKCKWPVGEPGADLFFCGAQSEDGKPYCTNHNRRAYRPKAVQNRTDPRWKQWAEGKRA